MIRICKTATDERIAHIAKDFPFLDRLTDDCIELLPKYRGYFGCITDALNFIVKGYTPEFLESVSECEAYLSRDGYVCFLNCGDFIDLFVLKYIREYIDCEYTYGCNELNAVIDGIGLLNRFKDDNELTLDDLESQVLAFDTAIRMLA